MELKVEVVIWGSLNLKKALPLIVQDWKSFLLLSKENGAEKFLIEASLTMQVRMSNQVQTMMNEYIWRSQWETSETLLVIRSFTSFKFLALVWPLWITQTNLTLLCRQWGQILTLYTNFKAAPRVEPIAQLERNVEKCPPFDERRTHDLLFKRRTLTNYNYNY